MKQSLLTGLLLLVVLNTTGCFSISVRSKMEGEQMSTYPGVAAYHGFVTRPFKQLNTEDSIFFGLLISPHLVVATADLPFSFIVDSIYLSSDQKRVNDWIEMHGKIFEKDWPILMNNIKSTKLEKALELVDKLGFKRFSELLRHSSEEEKILFAILKTIDESSKSYSSKYAVKALIKYSSKDSYR